MGVYVPKNTTELGADRPRLSAEMRATMFAENKFTALCNLGTNDKGERVVNIGTRQNPTPGKGVVLQYKGEFSQGGLDMDFLIEDRLVGNAIGNTTLKGTGETKLWWGSRLKIAALRHAVKVMTFEDAQKFGTALAAKYNDKNKSLIRWRNDWQEVGDLYSAMYLGYSQHLIANYRGITGGRTDLTPYSHTNSYYANVGPLGSANAPGTNGFEDDHVTALQNLQIGTTGHGIFFKLMLALNKVEADLNMTPPEFTNSNGMTVNDQFPCLISPQMWMQLLEDEDFKKALQMLPRGWDHPWFTNSKGCAAGHIFHVDRQMWGAQGAQGAITCNTTYTHVPQYGPTGNQLIGATDSSAFKPIIVLGKNALLQGIGKSAEVKEEIDDFETEIELGVQEISGVNRNDERDIEANTLTANAVRKNATSLMCWTAVKDAIGWGTT